MLKVEPKFLMLFCSDPDAIHKQLVSLAGPLHIVYEVDLLLATPLDREMSLSDATIVGKPSLESIVAIGIFGTNRCTPAELESAPEKSVGLVIKRAIGMTVGEPLDEQKFPGFRVGAKEVHIWHKEQRPHKLFQWLGGRILALQSE